MDQMDIASSDTTEVHTPRVLESISEDTSDTTSSNYSEVDKSHTISKASYSASRIPVKTLQLYFKLNFHHIATGPSPTEVLHMDIATLLSEMIKFFTAKEDVTPQEIIDSVLEGPTRDAIKIMFETKHYALNMKDNVSYNFKDEKLNPNMCRNSVDLQVREFLHSISDVLKKTRKTESFMSSENHDLVKDCVYKFAAVLSECQMGNGKCLNVIQATLPEPAVHETRSKKKFANPRIDTFVSKPDLTLGHRFKMTSPTVPVEVYCPLRYNSDKERKERKRASSSTGEETDPELNSFLDANTPPYISGQQSSSCRSRFRHKIAAQHVLQIISSAVNFSLVNYFDDQEEKAYLGLFVCNEYVHLTKIIGCQETFRSYALSSTFRDSPDDINVQFSPLVFDLSRHTHRIALLFFFKFYQQNWTSIKTEFKT